MASVLERIGSEAAISDGIPSNSDGSVSDDVGGGSDGGYSDDDFDHDDGAGDAELMEAAAIIARAKSRTQESRSSPPRSRRTPSPAARSHRRGSSDSKVEVSPPPSARGSAAPAGAGVGAGGGSRTASAAHCPPGLTVIRSRKGAALATKTNTAGGDRVLLKSRMPGAGATAHVDVRAVMKQAAMVTARRPKSAAGGRSRGRAGAGAGAGAGAWATATAGARSQRRPTSAAPGGRSSLERVLELSRPKDVPPSLMDQSASADSWARRNLRTRCSCGKKLCTPELPMPGCKRGKNVYAQAEEARNCRFRPKISRKSAKMAGDGQDCLIRMEAKERARQHKLKVTREEEAYAARQDKKVCRTCGGEQSYAEWNDGVKRCQRCPSSMFQPRVQWGRVQKGFLARMQQQQARREARLAKATAEENSKYGQPFKARQRLSRTYAAGSSKR